MALPDEPAPERGAHTLRVMSGVVVGFAGDDVFVELGPRMQGVLSVRDFAERPREGDSFEFTLKGQEEGLWALSLREEVPLVSWETMEPGTLVQAKVVRMRPGGYELMAGGLHSFLPRSQSGVPRDEDPESIVGRVLTCEVIEVDRERQRITCSRKVVLERERESERQRHVSALRPGTVVAGRIFRIEPYGAFVRFGRGLTGMIHISNLAHRRLDHPSEVVQLGDHVEARVLHVRDRGKRIGLGLKQLGESPVRIYRDEHPVGSLVAGTVVRVSEAGVVVSLTSDLEGFLPRSRMEVRPGRSVSELWSAGDSVTVMVEEIDPAQERIVLSRFHRDGSRVSREELEGEASYRELAEPDPVSGADLGEMMRRALGARRDASDSARGPHGRQG